MKNFMNDCYLQEMMQDLADEMQELKHMKAEGALKAEIKEQQDVIKEMTNCIEMYTTAILKYWLQDVRKEVR